MSSGIVFSFLGHGFHALLLDFMPTAHCKEQGGINMIPQHPVFGQGIKPIH
ncbi:hypothetical protein [Arsenophonus nasoniae]|uniref:Uncharacterized protein n=1 Tax=Arsenophonus nasoniae TaxID=638 RepID=A0AA95GWE5_9GAMM|nr:hypothetical protein [Arsenophonus nasoniae]WGM03989.1 hypothetical protein QE210_21390 [Arsenophonus nasoniae]